MAKYDETDGVWRTVGGRRIFIKNGQSLASAMKESGKFKKGTYGGKDDLKKKYAHAFPYHEKTEEEKEYLKETQEYFKDKDVKAMVEQAKEQEKEFAKQAEKEDKKIHKEPNERTIREELKDIEKERERKDLRSKGLTDEEIDKGYKDVNEAIKDKTNNEYELYKRAKENPDSIDPMTENSTDWEELDKKYSDRYESDKIIDRIKENKIVDSYEKYVIYQNKDGNWITSRENYNNFVNGKSDKLGGELILNEKEGRERLASYVADDKYPYKGYVDDMKSGNGKKAEAYKKEILDKMHKTIGYDESKYNYGLENKMSNSKYTIDYFKERGVDIRDEVPEGYVKLEGATTAPKGYEWYSNGKSRFGGEYKNALVKTVDNQITNSLRQKAYNKYMKEHPNSKMSFEDFLKKQ